MLQPKPVTIKIRVGEREKSLTNLFQFSSILSWICLRKLLPFFFFFGWGSGGVVVGEGEAEKDKEEE